MKTGLGLVCAAMAFALGACTTQDPAPREEDATERAALEILTEGPLSPGRYRVPFEGVDVDAVAAEVEVPSGFEVYNESFLWQDSDRGHASLSFWEVTGVNRHPCHREGKPRFVDPGPSLEDLAAALRRQPRRLGPEPTPVDFAGYDGLYLELRLPQGFDPAQCDTGHYEAWEAVDPQTLGAMQRYQYGPGEVDRIWILDVEGRRLVVNAAHQQGTPRQVVTDLTGMLDSIHLRVE